MIIKNKATSGDWEELYPKTISNNVLMESGKNLQEELFSHLAEIEYIPHEDDSSTGLSIVFKDKYFIYSAFGEATTISSGQYFYKNFNFPFENAGNYSAVASVMRGGVSISATDSVYIRNKYGGYVQVATSGSYSDGDTIFLEVIAFGTLED